MFEEMLGIRDSDDGVKLRLAADVLIDKESLSHRGGIGEPGGLNEKETKGKEWGNRCQEQDGSLELRAGSLWRKSR
ncbi:hypothetical protein QA641_31110 [Bradyrhizobium sp. CB1650]|nr:hypothetical protein [Bradyrhizobium sp. CB1650]WGD56904.1 hypothetical protein QA641_31110 [Bradyrhizobium sp. CB1650]